MADRSPPVEGHTYELAPPPARLAVWRAGTVAPASPQPSGLDGSAGAAPAQGAVRRDGRAPCRLSGSGAGTAAGDRRLGLARAVSGRDGALPAAPAAPFRGVAQ